MPLNLAILTLVQPKIIPLNISLGSLELRILQTHRMVWVGPKSIGRQSWC